MKKAIKIINTISIIVGAVDLVYMLILGGGFTAAALLNQEGNPAIIIVLIMGVICLFYGSFMIPYIIVSVIGLKKLKAATCKRDLRVIGIITIIFGNPVSGIFMLCIPESAFDPTPETQE